MKITKIDRDKLNQEIGSRLKRIRESCTPKLTQGELADMLGVKRTSITNIEQGTQRATLYLVYLLAEQLRIPLEQILPSPDDEKILTSVETSEVEEVNLGEEIKIVPSKVKLLYEKL